jgi:hypothetical protein
MTKKLFETIHFYSFILLLVLPHIASNSFYNSYGIYISTFIAIVITSWIHYQNCPLGICEENNSKWGSIITYINKRLNIKTHKWTKLIWIVITLLYSISGYLFAYQFRPLQLYISIITISYFKIYFNSV